MSTASTRPAAQPDPTPPAETPARAETLRTALAPVAALLAGTGLLYIGYGLQATLVPLRAGAEGFSRLAIGLLGSSYYAGFVVGCLFAPYLILRAGHIRTFTALVALISAVTVAFPLLVAAPFWMACRFVIGLAIAGLLVIVESWLNETSTRATRGAVMSAYIVVTYLTISLGQLGVVLQPLTSFTLFSLCSIVLSLSALPVALTRATQPAPIPVVRFRPMRLWRLAPAAFAGVFTSGVLNGSSGALGAVFATDVGFSTTEAAVFASAVVLGGATGQYPFGRASDFFDRRVVMIAALCLTAASALGLALAAGTMPDLSLVAFGFGVGFTMLPVYSLAAAHAFDCAEPADMVETSAGLLILYGGGSMIGPLAASATMGLAGPGGLFLMIAAAAAALAVFVVARIAQKVASDSGRVEFEIYSTAPVGCAIVPEMAGETPVGLVTPDRTSEWTGPLQQPPAARDMTRREDVQ